MRYYVTLALFVGSLLALSELVTAVILDYFVGIPDLGARSLNVQSWLVIAAFGGGGIAFFFFASAVAEVHVSRRASISLDAIVLGRGGDVRWPPSLFGNPHLPARIDVGAIHRLQLMMYDPERTFPMYRWYRFWRAELELSDGRVVPLDPSTDGFFHPLALPALAELASYLKKRGVDVEVREAGRFHLWKRLDTAPR